MEKQPYVNTTQVEADSPPSTPAEERHVTHWQPSYVKRFPLQGVAALGGIVLCAFAAAGVLIGSDGRSTVYWPSRYAPNVAISAINSVANLLLGMAVVEGVAITWWRKALHGATVEELHRSWLFSTRVSSLFYNFFRLDRIAVAALATKIAIADGILLQRATSQYVASDDPRDITMNGIAATTFPTTGYVVDDSSFMIGDAYTPVVNTWETSNGFFQGFNDFFAPCNGICYSHIEAIGFEIDCQKSKEHRDLATNAIAAWNTNHGAAADPSPWTDVPIFNSSFTLSHADQSTNFTRLNFKLEYFQSDNPYSPNSASCPGFYTQVQCQLRPAIISYPIKVMNYSNLHVVNGVSLGQLSDPDTSASTTISGENSLLQNYVPEYDFADKQAEGFNVVRYIYPSESRTIGATTTLGGIADALSQYLASTASITYTGTELWALHQQGTLSQTMMYGPPNMGSCDCSFKDDSLATIVAGINQLTFLTATGMVDRTSYNRTGHGISPGTQAKVFGITNDTFTSANWTRLTRTLQIADVTHYRTHYLFMGLGLATMMSCVALVAPTFWSYGEVGRKVTLGPMEIAHAFGSPVLARNRHGQIVQEGDIDGLVKAVGDRRVRYGFVEENDHHNGGGGGGSSSSYNGGVASMVAVIDSHDQVHNGAPSPNIGHGAKTAAHQTYPISPTSPVGPNSNRRSVVLRMDDPEKVSPAVGRSSAAFSPVSSPRSANSKSWS